MQRLTRRSILFTCAWAAALATRANSARPDPSRLYFDDLLKFENLIALDAIENIASDYLAVSSRGLAAYLKAYKITADDYTRRFHERPRFYRSLSGLSARLASHESSVVDAMAKIRAMLPGTPDVPIFLFVGTLGPGSTVKEVRAGDDARSLGILIPAENLAISEDTDMSEFPEGRAGRGEAKDIAGLVAHEYAHVAQVQIQGLRQYRELYSVPGRATNLAFAVREGGADFVSYLATGQLRERHRYFLQNRAKIIDEFRKIAEQPVADYRGWFSGLDPARPDRPLQIGYALGWDICRKFYESIPDKMSALRTIVSAREPAEFKYIAQGYR